MDYGAGQVQRGPDHTNYDIERSESQTKGNRGPPMMRGQCTLAPGQRRSILGDAEGGGTIKDLNTDFETAMFWSRRSPVTGEIKFHKFALILSPNVR